MNIEKLKKVCVIGGGLMGRHIALNTAIHGYETSVFDAKPGMNEEIRRWAADYLEGRVAKGRMTPEQASAALARFDVASSLEDAAAGSQLVIEAIIEEKNAKTTLFKKINELVDKDAIIATNSSYMVSSMFTDCVDNPSRLANLHYFSPALVMKLTEVVQGAHASDETAEFLMEFSRRTGKTPILLKKECEGFVVNRCLRALRDEVCRIVDEGISTPQETDTALELGLGHPKGVFRLADFTGIELAYQIYENRYRATGTKPPGYDLFKAKYDAGELGRKTGKGFYDYTE